MKIAILPADTGACGHYRTIWPADAVRALHPDWDIKVYDPRTVRAETTTTGRLLRVHGIDFEDLDVLVTQRVGSPTIATLLEAAQARGVATVMDMDDAMWCLDRDNTAYKAWNNSTRNRSRVHWSVTDHAATMADLVTVTTPALAKRYGKHGRVEVLPNRIPHMAMTAGWAAGEVSRERTADGVVFGWPGFLSTHPKDPHVIGDAMARISALSDVRAAGMGDGFRLGKIWGCEVSKIDPTSLGPDYYNRLATAFDVGLVPLDLEGSSAEFNRSKSSLKALELAATGSAVIASPSPANLEFSREVPIRLAGNPDEWEGHMRVLLDPSMRDEQVEKQTAAIYTNGWVLQDRAADWAAAWERAANCRAKINARG